MRLSIKFGSLFLSFYTSYLATKEFVTILVKVTSLIALFIYDKMPERVVLDLIKLLFMNKKNSRMRLHMISTILL